MPRVFRAEATRVIVTVKSYTARNTDATKPFIIYAKDGQTAAALLKEVDELICGVLKADYE